MEWWAAITVVAIPSQPALLMWPFVSFARPSVLSPRASRAILHSRHPADCILHIWVQKLAVVVFPDTTIPNRLLRRHGIFLSLRYLTSINLPASCLSMICYPCTVERLVDVCRQEITRVILCRLILNDIIIHMNFFNDIIMLYKIVWHFYVINFRDYVV